MKTIVHRAQARGYANHGWLESHHSFSFAEFHDPERTHYGLLRVLNDDKVSEGRGFGTHPHENMEIISIPLSGDLQHEDSMGTKSVIRQNDVQVMSAGTGIYHSEYNKNADQPVAFLQIWIFPKLRNITPRYDQKTYDPTLRKNKLQRIVSPIDDEMDSVKINQDAYLHRLDLDMGKNITYPLLRKGNGVYVFVLNGSATLAGEELSTRDAIAVSGALEFEISAITYLSLLFIEIPMN